MSCIYIYIYTHIYTSLNSVVIMFRFFLLMRVVIPAWGWSLSACDDICPFPCYNTNTTDGQLSYICPKQTISQHHTPHNQMQEAWSRTVAGVGFTRGELIQQVISDSLASCPFYTPTTPWQYESQENIYRNHPRTDYCNGVLAPIRIELDTDQSHLLSDITENTPGDVLFAFMRMSQRGINSFLSMYGLAIRVFKQNTTPQNIVFNQDNVVRITQVTVYPDVEDTVVEIDTNPLSFNYTNVRATWPHVIMQTPDQCDSNCVSNVVHFRQEVFESLVQFENAMKSQAEHDQFYYHANVASQSTKNVSENSKQIYRLWFSPSPEWRDIIAKNDGVQSLQYWFSGLDSQSATILSVPIFTILVQKLPGDPPSIVGRVFLEDMPVGGSIANDMWSFAHRTIGEEDITIPANNTDIHYFASLDHSTRE